jgi:phosphotransferase system  glucose/maltose/N-acetylglucosamine-specific IIC component
VGVCVKPFRRLLLLLLLFSLWVLFVGVCFGFSRYHSVSKKIKSFLGWVCVCVCFLVLHAFCFSFLVSLCDPGEQQSALDQPKQKKKQEKMQKGEKA